MSGTVVCGGADNGIESVVRPDRLACRQPENDEVSHEADAANLAGEVPDEEGGNRGPGPP